MTVVARRRSRACAAVLGALAVTPALSSSQVDAGIAELVRVSHARVAATLWSARAMPSGASVRGDPQFGIGDSFPAVQVARELTDGDTIQVGDVTLRAHATAGHTPGGTSWSWRSCVDSACIDFVYADSQTPISADGFLFTRNDTYPEAIRDVERGHATLESLPCDFLITPHPGASELLSRMAMAERGERPAPGACKRYVESARRNLAKRTADARAKP